ncbi:1,4-dihydroxy-2-naphthoate octaprenyltransferase [Cardiobacteriaceae bacterium TAE3-ERU3]|nr:1,4-dihydroxy-2-naphthoate octaprenyltransferase [Cardiobacteriaceae bacterium TAE3-ERU3]
MLRLSVLLALIRPRTLLLGIAVMLPGNAVAWRDGQFSVVLFALMLATTIALQSLSNIANDYGDGKRGTDDQRIGPVRMVASGALSLRAVRRCMWVCALLVLLLGASLLFLAFDQWVQVADFAVLGILSMLAAVGYTVGRYAYGYYGLGEIAVFVFFGLLAVMGSYYLQTHQINSSLWIVACGCGLFAAAVLMINNLRDLDNDRDAGKHTVAVFLGRKYALLLYGCVLFAGLLCYLMFALMARQWGVLLCIILMPMLIKHIHRLRLATSAHKVGAELPAIVVINLLVNGLFVVGTVLSALLFQ